MSDFEMYMPESASGFEDFEDFSEGAYDSALEVAPAAATIALIGAGFELMSNQETEEESATEKFSKRLGNIFKGLGAIILAPLAIATAAGIVGVPL